MNQMNMQGMHPAAGGPVGGIPMMNTGSSAPRSDPNNPNVSPDHNMVVQLNTYIYDYFLKRGYIDCARALVKDSNVPMNTAAPSKFNHRDGEVNGVDLDAMATDSNDDMKAKVPDDLPRPNLNGDMQQTSFLFDWFNLFWDVFWAQRRKGKSPEAMQYLQHTQCRVGWDLADSVARTTQHMAQLQQISSGMPNGLMNPGVMPNQGDVMPLHDGQGMLPMQDYYAPNGQMAQMRPGMQTPGGQAGGGNHALQDYQMQLMLLEQQNKRRLMIARQEQEIMAHADGQPGMVQPNLAPGTSPQGSRTGASPNPNEQMKRGTPKLPQTGLPGSPNVGDAMGQGRGSPASMNFAGGQIPPDMGGAAFFNVKPEGLVGPNGMRPPSSNPAFSGPQMTQPMDAMTRPQPPGTANRMPSGNWQQNPQGQPMIPQPGQAQTAGTPQERNAMPPPQAPAAGGATGRVQPPSPQPGAVAPPTPQQANKPAPKTKKDTKDTRVAKSKVPANAGNTAATPSSEAEPPPTPTPSTPITPVHPNSFNKAGPGAATNGAQPTSAPAPQAIGQQPPQPSQLPQTQPQQQPQPPQPQQDPNLTFGDINIPDNNTYGLDFAGLENPDLLESFDFDTFLNNEDPNGFTFESNLTYNPDGVEAGAGDTL
ncbi:OefA protein [Uncinocarpus reesii 1704]|uniref:OefA protein n=1 Tax=Uncinocarpus reesii (strain UAMH 1704) TaxID=336963 RepID=C4JKE9_UNCRE|nr:OefA protein [Uncinocarpus reesii 1704]EEP77257.1 OefA protein [Uncinocarpus reesii 1704]